MPSVLVVDDDPIVRALVGYTLEAYDVRLAASGPEAMARVAAEQPDLVVLDLMMPGLSGLQVLESWRADVETSRLPVILLTARAQESDVDRGFELGADDYVVKPFSPLELERRVAAVLARRSRG
jgi:two-component system, OmpR family, phosphate regulon response regulator PhoB